MVAITLLLAASSLAASTEKVLYSFAGPAAGDGFGPQSGLAFDAKGNLYGTTSDGGTGAGCLNGCGTVFQLTSNKHGGWQETVIYNFQGDVTDGDFPNTTPVVDAAGNVYGMTKDGPQSCGIVYKLTPSRSGGFTETLIHIFSTSVHNNDGCINGDPSQVHINPLIMDKNGNLYGSTAFGGGGSSNRVCRNGCGIVFKLASQSDGTWKETILHHYPTDSGREGFSPTVYQLDDAGNLYGLAGGGCSSCAGLVFKLSPSKQGNWPETVLFQSHISDLATVPVGGLLMDKAGNFFAPTYGPQCNSCGGAIARLSPAGGGKYKATIIHVFKNHDGVIVNSGLLKDAAGNLYGTTLYGGGRGTSNCPNGEDGCGTIYTLSPASNGKWHERILFRFDDNTDGGVPADDVLLQDAHQNIYGTTSAGGKVIFSNGATGGNVFELTH